MQQHREGCLATHSMNTATRAVTRAEGDREQVTEMEPHSWCGEQHGLRLQVLTGFPTPSMAGE